MVLYRGLMTIYFKIRVCGCNTCKHWQKNQKRQIQFIHQFVPKYITSCVTWVNFHFKCVTQYSGVIQGPRDHLFKKLGYLGATRACFGKKAKNATFSFFFSVVPKYLTNWEIEANQFIICSKQFNGVIQGPRDHLFQNQGMWVQHI